MLANTVDKKSVIHAFTPIIFIAHVLNFKIRLICHIQNYKRFSTTLFLICVLKKHQIHPRMGISSFGYVQRFCHLRQQLHSDRWLVGGDNNCTLWPLFEPHAWPILGILILWSRLFLISMRFSGDYLNWIYLNFCTFIKHTIIYT